MVVVLFDEQLQITTTVVDVSGAKPFVVDH